MSARHAYQQASDSKSLWNYTLSPGFTKLDVRVLRLAIARYGCGTWTRIKPHFPEKTNGQLNLQCQKLFGQQSLAAWSGVHVDPLVIKKINDKKDVPLRKNGCIINTGRNMTQLVRKRLKKENEDRYGLPQEIYNRIKVPILKVERPVVTQNDQVRSLGKLYHVYDILAKKVTQIENGELTEAKSTDSSKDNEAKKKDNEAKPQTNGKSKKANKKPRGKAKGKGKGKGKGKATPKNKNSVKKNDSSSKNTAHAILAWKPSVTPPMSRKVQNSRKRKTYINDDDPDAEDEEDSRPPTKKAKMMLLKKKPSKSNVDVSVTTNKHSNNDNKVENDVSMD